MKWIKGISKNKENQIKNIILEHIKKGSSYKEIAKDLESLVKDKNKEYKIAHTETARIVIENQLKRYQDNGIKRVEWVSGKDVETCTTCRKRNGKQFSIQKAKGLIPTHICCRCCWAPRV